LTDSTKLINYELDTTHIKWAETTVHRRQFFGALPAVWLSAPVIAEAARQPTVNDLVAELLKRLEEIYGGDWKSSVDGHGEFVMLCRH
jgi:hypothetical protein